MKLRELKEKIDYYDVNHRTYSNFLGRLRTSTGRHKRVQAVCQFYELEIKQGKKAEDKVDLYALVKLLISFDNKKTTLTFIENLCTSIGDPYFFSGIAVLEQHNCLESSRFDQIYRLTQNKVLSPSFKILFINLMNLLHKNEILEELQQEIIDFVFESLENNQNIQFFTAIDTAFSILKERECLTEDSLTAFMQSKNEFPFTLWLIENLNNIVSPKIAFKDLYLPLVQHEDKRIKTFLANLYHNRKLYPKNKWPKLAKPLVCCIKPSDLHLQLVDQINTLFSYNRKLLTAQTIKFLFKIENEFDYLGLPSNLAYLMEVKLLNKELIAPTINCKNKYFLTIYLDRFSKFPDYKPTTENILHFISLTENEPELYLDCCSYFFSNKIPYTAIQTWLNSQNLSVVQYLVKNVLVRFEASEEIIQSIMQYAHTYSLTSAKQVNELLTLLKKEPFYTKNIGLALFHLKPAYFKQMLIVVKALARNNNLTQASFLSALNKMKAKRATPEPTQFHLRFGSDGQKSWTQYSSAKLGIHFFVPDKESNYSGGTGKILEAYDNLSQQNPQYVVKKIDIGHEPFQHLAKKLVVREVKYGRQMFSRKFAHYYQQGDQWCVVSDWQPGNDLFNTLNIDDTISELSPEKKITCILPILKKLVELHAEYRVHGDLKPENCIYNPETEQLTLIDFGSTRKLKEKDQFISATLEFVDKRLYNLVVEGINIVNEYSFPDDMYSFGLIFHELFSFMTIHWEPENHTHKIDYEPISQKFNPFEKAIYFLELSLLHENPNARVSAQNTLAFLEMLLKEGMALTEENMLRYVKVLLNESHALSEDNIVHHSESPRLIFG